MEYLKFNNGHIGLLSFRDVASADQRLIWFPFGGGGAHSFRDTAGALPESWSVLAIDPPGHLRTLGDPLTDLDAICSLYLEHLGPHFFQGAILCGQSVGALVAARIAHRLEDMNAQASGVILGAARPPTTMEKGAKLSQMGERETFLWWCSILGTLRSGFDSEAMFEVFYPIIKADLKVFESCIDLDLRCRYTNFLVVGGDGDTICPREVINAWTDYTPNVQLARVSGGHLFVLDSPREFGDVICTFASELNGAGGTDKYPYRNSGLATDTEGDHIVCTIWTAERYAQTPLRIPVSVQNSTSSFAQQLVLTMEKFRPRTGVNYDLAVSVAYRLIGPLNVNALNSSIIELIRRHDSVTTTSNGAKDHKTFNSIIPGVQTAAFTIQDISFAIGDTEIEAIQRFLANERSKEFNIMEGPLICSSLGRITNCDHILCLTAHYLVCDALSLEILMHDLEILYSSICKQATPNHPDILDDAGKNICRIKPDISLSYDQAIEYWQSNLSEAKLMQRDALQFGKWHNISPEADSIDFELGDAVSKALHEIAISCRATNFIVGLAAWEAYLYLHTGETDITVPTLSLGRGSEDQEHRVGLFLNMLLLRTKIDPNSTFVELISQVRSTCLSGYEYEIPFIHLLDQVPEVRLLLSDTNFLLLPYQAVQSQRDDWQRFGAATRTLVDRCLSKNAGFSFPLDGLMSLKDRGDMFVGCFEYALNIFDRTKAQAIVNQYHTLLKNLLNNPHLALTEYASLTTNDSVLQTKGCD